jgi:hypothetical protein
MAEKKQEQTPRAQTGRGRHGGRRDGPVLIQWGRWRVTLSARRDRYWLQERDRSGHGGWRRVATAETFSNLTRDVITSAAPDDFVELVCGSGLPDEPTDAAPIAGR